METAYTIEAQEWVDIQKSGFKMPSGSIADFFFCGKQYVTLSEEQANYIKSLVPVDKIKTLKKIAL